MKKFIYLLLLVPCLLSAQRLTTVPIAAYAGGHTPGSGLTINSTSWSTDAGTITLSATVPAGTDTGYTVTDNGGNSYLITSFSGSVLTCQDFDSTTDPTTGGSVTIQAAHSTIQAAEDNLDDTIIYRSGDAAIIWLYSGGGAFDESVTMNGGVTVGLNSAKMTVPVSDRHDGTAGTGSRIVATIGRIFNLSAPSGFNGNYSLEWLEIDQNGNAENSISAQGSNFGDVTILRNVLVHDQSGGDALLGFVRAPTRDCLVMNSIFYDNTRNTAAAVKGLHLDSDQANGGCLNNTVFNVNNAGAGDAIGIHIPSDDSDGRVRNNISMGTTVGGVGTATDFTFGGSTNLTSSNNMSEDATADDGGGSNHVISVSVANQFVSTLGGFENLHIQDTDANSFEAGVDLVVTPTNVNFDIDNFNRNSGATTWSIGAHDGDNLRGGAAPTPATKPKGKPFIFGENYDRKAILDSLLSLYVKLDYERN